MKFPSEPNEMQRIGFVSAVLQEAARYETETGPPDDLITEAMARHNRSGKRCQERRPVPVLVAATCGLALLAGAGLWLRTSHRASAGHPAPDADTAFRSEQKTVVAEGSTLPHLDLASILLAPVDSARSLTSLGGLQPLRRAARHYLHDRQRMPAARSHPLSTPTNPSHSVWTTETVHREVITQTVTPVWVARADPETSTIVLTPALFQVALEPDDASDPTETQVSATLIPVRFEQENTQP
ncbi:MAG: hypothetical protein JWL77_3430 [Chthonomonadaceae bacterium]|nr:hypothetical protein [Chthonomonadaceae bacterium]